MPSLTAAAAAHGLAASHRRAEEVDAHILGAVGDRGADILARDDLAFVAVGSYGRRELSPHSDVDVLILHEIRDVTRVEEITKTLLYPLWDEGFELGYAVRTVGECLKWAKGDPIIATTLHDTRLVAGSRSLVDDLTTDLDRWLAKRGAGLQRALLESVADRHARFGDAGVDVEPHVKEGRGGLRDLQTLRWIDRETDVNTELDVLLAVRNALHSSAGRGIDRLQKDLLDPVTEMLDIDGAAEPTGDPRDALMRELFDVCRRVGARLGWGRLERLRPAKRYKAPAGFSLEAGRLGRPRSTPPDADTEAGIRAALECDRIAPAASLITWAQSGGTGSLPWSDRTREAVETLLAQGSSAAWEFLDVTGLWVRYFPELAPARCKTQHNPLHQLCVDAHCWETLREARRVGSDAGSLAGKVAADLGRPTLLHLAALLHDAGKGMPGDHSREGVIIARRILERMGYGAGTQELVAFAIANHLLLPEFATTRDLNDEELVTDLASRIRSPERLQLLYLLTIADATATGPAAWSAWKASLVDELFLKCAHVLEVGELTGREARNRHERTRAEVLRHLRAAGRDAAAGERLVDAFPRRYLLVESPRTIIGHLDAVEAVSANRDAVRVVPCADDDNRIAVVAHDRPGLLAHVSGALALRGVDVRTADVYTRADGVAVDVLTIGEASRVAGASERTRLEEDIVAAQVDGGALADRVRERALRYDAPGEPQVDVTIDNSASDWYSAVDVRGTDRVGLLFDIATVFAEMGLNVHFAKVLTQAGVAHDSFSVRDADGAKLDDPQARAQRIKARLAEAGRA